MLVEIKSYIQDAWHTHKNKKTAFFWFGCIISVRKCLNNFFIRVGVFTTTLTSLSHVYKQAKMNCGVTVVVGIFSSSATTLIGNLQNATIMFDTRLVHLGSLFLISSADLLMSSASHITCIRCRWNTFSSSDTAGVYDAVASAQKDCSLIYCKKM